MNIRRIIVIIIFVFLTILFCEAENQFIQFGGSAGYIGGYDDNENFIKIDGNTRDNTKSKFISYFNGEYLHGIYFGGSINLELYKRRKISHNVILKSYFELFYKSGTFNENIQFLEYGIVKTGIISQKFTFTISYLTFEALYKFNFASNHIGVSIGPSYSYLLGNAYEVSEEFLVVNGETKIRGNEARGELSELSEHNLVLCLGLEYIIELDKFKLVPNISYYPIARDI
ncbi:MAG: hypothetical protein V1779_11470 [bacterium]